MPPAAGLAAVVNWYCGGATVSVKPCDGVLTPLLALIVTKKAPLVPNTGVPLISAVPFPLSVKLTPVGRLPEIPNEGAG